MMRRSEYEEVLTGVMTMTMTMTPTSKELERSGSDGSDQ